MISKLKYLGFILLLFSLFSLASCSNEDDVVKRLTNKQKETYAQNISGEYPGQYVIIYKNKDCIEGKDEAGRPITVAHSEAFGDVQVDVSDNKMLHVFFQDFPVSLISKVVDADEGLSHALAGASPQAITLAGASPQAITARYGFDYDTDFLHIIWAFIPNVMLLNLNYGDTDHHIRIEFNNNSQTYKFTENELKQPKAFGSLAENGIALQLEAIYDGSTLIQRFGYENGNYMHILFKTD